VYVVDDPGDDGSRPKGVLLASVESLDQSTLGQLRRLGCGPVQLVVTRHRAQSMGLPMVNRGGAENTADSAHAAMSFHLNGEEPKGILHLASGLTPEGGWKGEGLGPANRFQEAGLNLARLGRILPAMVAVAADPHERPELAELLEKGILLTVPVDEVEALAGAPQLQVTHVSDAPVPLPETENTRFLLFRENHGFFEHVAVLIGDRDEWPDPVPVRLHSACLTGDLFGSLRCDCGEQLHGSLRKMADAGGGVLLYLQQEGRGIGLGNKLRAYSLQEEGLDTVDADGALGFGADERRYDSAVEILRRLDIRRIRLLTNNPEKMRAVDEGGIEIVDRIPLHGTLNRHNLPYVRAKVQRAGHWLESMLAQSLPTE